MIFLGSSIWVDIEDMVRHIFGFKFANCSSSGIQLIVEASKTKTLLQWEKGEKKR